MSQENVELTRQWFARLNDGQPPLDLCDKQIEMWNPDGFPVVGPYHGRDGIRQWAFETFEEVLEEARAEPEEVLDVGGGKAVAVLRQTGVWKQTQLPLDFQWAAVMTFREGKLAHAQGYLSKAEALEAVGLTE